MQQIYRSLQINFDHLFLTCLKYAPHRKLDYDNLIYSLALIILFLRGEQDKNHYRLHPSLTQINTINDLLHHHSHYFQAILNQALAEKLVRLVKEMNGSNGSKETKTFIVYKDKLREKMGFHVIRLAKRLSSD